MTPEQHIEIAHERIKETKIMLDNNCCGAACKNMGSMAGGVFNQK